MESHLDLLAAVEVNNLLAAKEYSSMVAVAADHFQLVLVVNILAMEESLIAVVTSHCPLHGMVYIPR